MGNGQPIAVDWANARTTIFRQASEEIEMNTAMLKMFRSRPAKSGRFLARKAIATALVAVITFCSAAAAEDAPPGPQNDSERAPTVRERIMAMPPHTMVQVKLHNKKIRGRLRLVTRKGFVIQVSTEGRADNEKIAFDDVESVRAIEGNGKGASVSVHIVIDGGEGGGVDVQIDH